MAGQGQTRYSGPPLAPSPATIPAPPAPTAPPLPLADVGNLLDGSRPQPFLRQLGRGILAVWVIALLGPVLGLPPVALETAALLATVAAIVLLSVRGSALNRETTALDELEALLALRRVDEAVPGLQDVMGRPMHGPENRLRAMLLLGTTLARLNRSDDALRVYGELLDAEGLAGPAAAMVKLARAATMLRADHLYDADRAISDLRRTIGRDDGADPIAVAGLRLVELHRDVKTGHLAEAVDLFDAHLPSLRAGLGHRVAEAHALVAIALHRLNRGDEAAARFADATALAPLSDLVRRYPELWPLYAGYPTTAAPVSSPGMAGRGLG